VQLIYNYFLDVRYIYFAIRITGEYY